MARKAKRKAAASAKTRKRAAKRGPAKAAKARRAKTRRAKTGKAKTGAAKSMGMATKSARRQKEPIPAEPAGRVALPRRSNRNRPDARFDDPRLPDSDAREQPDGARPAYGPRNGYRNTDERF